MKYIKSLSNFLLEKSLYATDFTVESFIEKLKKNKSDYVSYIIQYAIENNIEDDEVNENSIEFKDWLYNRVKKAYNYTIAYFKDLIGYKNNNNIFIYRALTINDSFYNDFKNYGKHLGIYWTFDENAAEAHYGKYDIHSNEAVIYSEINEQYVNWDETIYLNTNINWEMEKEIRLFKNTPLKILKLTINGEDVDISEIKNKIFYS